MTTRAKFARWFAAAGLLLALVSSSSFGSQRNDQRPAPRPSQQQRSVPRPQARPRSESRQQPRTEPRPQAREGYRSYRPPETGHHSGQWLNQHREQSLDQQRRALENDPGFHKLSPDQRRQYEQRLQRFDNLPADRQQQVLRRMETWEHLTDHQKQQLRDYNTQFRALPPDRRQAVKSAVQNLRAMPPEARQREIESGRFSQFSPQEKSLLNDASRLPLAPAESNGGQPEPPATGPGRYIPRPPQ